MTELMSSSLDVADLRKRMRAELPGSVFTANTARMIWALPLTLIVVVGWWGILGFLDAWWSKLLVSALVTAALGSLAFLAHEVLHGAMGGQRRLQNAVAWLGLGPILTPPEFWRSWHNRMHHGHTNHKVRDLDHFGTLARHKKRSLANRLVSMAPGSGNPLSYLFCFYSFSLHAQLLLWTATSRHPSFKGRTWKREKVQSIALVTAWLALAWVSGGDAVYTALIPFMGANAIIQSYIVTNHWLRPHTSTNNPLENTLSLVVPQWMDRLHFRFSHHVEHHLLPGVGSDQLPNVRQWLLNECPGKLALATFPEAMIWLYKTPRTYRTATELARVEEPERVFDLVALGEHMKKPPETRAKVSVETFWSIRPQ